MNEHKPFTNEELEQRRNDADAGKDVGHRFWVCGQIHPKYVLREILRFLATLRARDATIEALALAILKCSPDIYRKAAAAFGCSEDMEQAHELAKAAIREATNGS